MWAAVEFDDLPGRVRAVSAPDSRQMLVIWTTDGLYGVWFTRAATVLRMGSVADSERAFDPKQGVLKWKDVAFRMHGECGAAGQRFGCDLPTVTATEERLVFDAAGKLQSVNSPNGETTPIPDPPQPKKWSAVGFSEDGRYLLVAHEWGVRLFRFVPTKGKPPVRSAAQSAEQQALFRVVCEQPDDDTPRLVYADWLQEHGQTERGELIRLQCEYARHLRYGESLPDEARMAEVLQTHGDIWQAELPVIRGVKWSGFWRGFPGVTIGAGGTLARNATAIWNAAPVESVMLSKLDVAGATALAKMPQASRLRVLEVRGYSSFRDNANALESLLATDAASGLWWLAFQGTSRLGARAIEVLANSESLRNLELLTLRYCEIDNETARALAAAKGLPKLREVDLLGNELTDDVPALLRNRFPRVLF